MNPSNTCYKIYVIQPRTLRVRKGTNNFLNYTTFLIIFFLQKKRLTIFDMASRNYLFCRYSELKLYNPGGEYKELPLMSNYLYSCMYRSSMRHCVHP